MSMLTQFDPRTYSMLYLVQLPSYFVLSEKPVRIEINIQCKIRNVQLRLKGKKGTALLGQNGAGKTTTMSMLTGNC
jgi:ABC-type Mn2+/Zn2+ transport system ATPase subunit